MLTPLLPALRKQMSRGMHGVPLQSVCYKRKVAHMELMMLEMEEYQGQYEQEWDIP